MSENWKDYIDWEFPYKGHVMSNPQYLKDKNECFTKNGNGWWCNDGKGWDMNPETVGQRNKRYEKRKLKNEQTSS